MTASPDTIKPAVVETHDDQFDHALFIDSGGMSHGGSNSFNAGSEPARFGVVEPGFETEHRVRSHKLLLVASGNVTISPTADSGAISQTYSQGEYLTFPVDENFGLQAGTADEGGFSYVSRKVGTSGETSGQRDVVAACEATFVYLKERGIGAEDWPMLARAEKYRRLEAVVGNTAIEETELDGHIIRSKDESSQPGGSHYARPWVAMLKSFEQKGLITPGSTEIRDITSGSSGAVAALFGSLLDYQVRIMVPEELPANRIYPIVRFGARVVSTGPGYIQGSSAAQRAEIYALKATADWERVRLPPDVQAKPVIFDNGSQLICYANHSEDQKAVNAFARIADELAEQAPDMTHLLLGEGNWTSIAGISPRLRTLLPGVEIVGYTGDAADMQFNFGLTIDDSIPFSYKQPDALLDREEIVTGSERNALAQQPTVAAKHLGRSSVMGLVVAQRLLKENPEAQICTIIYDRDDRY